MTFVVSKAWFSHALDQVKSITSKHTTELFFQHWLDGEEKPSDEIWGELDSILSRDIFKSLTRVDAACVHRDSDDVWRYVDSFDKSRFSTLMPLTFKRGILIW